MTEEEYELKDFDNAKKAKILENLKAYIKKMRKIKGLTGVNLSLACGLSRNYIAMLESGKLGIPKMEYLIAIANALEIPIEELFEIVGFKLKSKGIKKEDLTIKQKISIDASKMGLSGELTRSLINVVEAILNQEEQETTCRFWFHAILREYSKIKVRTLKSKKDKEAFKELINEIANFEASHKYNISNITI